MKLVRLSGSEVLVAHLQKADNMWSRNKGLLGRTHLDADSALWILRCNAIHTFFMKFSIDLIFVDRHLVVKKTYANVRPWRIRGPVFGATSVIELSAGFLKTTPINIGDKLHVDHSLS